MYNDAQCAIMAAKQDLPVYCQTKVFSGICACSVDS